MCKKVPGTYFSKKCKECAENGFQLTFSDRTWIYTNQNISLPNKYSENMFPLTNPHLYSSV